MKRAAGNILWALFVVLVVATITAKAQTTPGTPVLTQVGASYQGAYAAVYPDEMSCGTNPCSSPSPIATATSSPQTVQVVTGDALSQRSIFVFFLGVQSAGTNTGMAFKYVYGTGTKCGTGTTPLAEPIATATSAPTSGQVVYSYGAGPLATVSLSAAPAPVPIPVPAGDNVCITTTGTATDLYPLVLYAYR